ncbi:hypothetical protein LUW75_07355 [Streptomyces sp. MRC013]|uniref:hypothetical protein n=1 Tax=Streptomyces sp. MRC013 TaxID=2898276 RepID=UPI0020265762|nr:hypothetical protein [Streptomyces sp. MRC013]URM89839.1 hypothetical protein LUW75_07355 [Streptomyces sp. MRC013]
MPTAIAVTSADLVLPPSDPHTPGAVVLPPPGAQSLAAALADTQALVERYGHLVALYPASTPHPHVHRLHTVRALLESDRIALLPLDLPPLGVAVLARQLRQLSACDFGPGVLATAARLLAHYVHAGAVLNSVARLDRVPVTLKAHAKSWVPGSQFAVLANPEPRLVRLGSQGGDPFPGPEFATRMAVARGQLAADWVTGTLAPAWRVQGVDEVPRPAASAAWWGTAKLVEFAAYLPDLPVLHQLVSSVRRETCAWCGVELLGDRCGFCAAPLAPPHAPEARGPLAAPAPGTPTRRAS